MASFGLEMKELERITDGKKDSGTKSYVLRSALPAGLRSALVHNSAREVHVGFMMVVLALIMMNGDKMESGGCQSACCTPVYGAAGAGPGQGWWHALRGWGCWVETESGGCVQEQSACALEVAVECTAAPAPQ
jgi:hypothetical protein